jgi:hypothetical protein
VSPPRSQNRDPGASSNERLVPFNPLGIARGESAGAHFKWSRAAYFPTAGSARVNHVTSLITLPKWNHIFAKLRRIALYLSRAIRS